MADPITLGAVEGLLRVAATSNRARGVVELLVGMIETLAADLSDDVLRTASALTTREQFDVEEGVDRGGHLPELHRVSLPTVDVEPVRRLAREELLRREASP
jgi:hypothetical protein